MLLNIALPFGFRTRVCAATICVPVREQLPLSTRHDHAAMWCLPGKDVYCKHTKRTAATSTPIALVVVLFGCTVEVALGRGYAWPEMNGPSPGRSWGRYFYKNSPRNWLRLKTKFWNNRVDPGLCSPHQYRIYFWIKFSRPKKTQTHFNPERGTAQLHKFVYKQERVHNLDATKVFVSCQKLFC